ncbi:MAG TPA: hypothetical protein VF337_09085 [Candidatus Limnocylindrales bacterium]
MSKNISIKSFGPFQTAVVAGAVVVGLVLSTGQLTAAPMVDSVTATPGVASVDRQAGITETAIYADSRPDIFARAGKARDAFGFPAGQRRTGRHVHDGYQHSEYDEVSDVDSAGNTVSMTQFDQDGSLVSAVRFDTPPALATGSSGEAATKAAQRGLAAQGMRTLGQARVKENSVSGGWDLHWDRVEAGLAVRGDETSVHVWQDGRIQSVAKVEHKLAAAPARRLSEAEADQAVDHQMNAWFSGKDSGYSADNTGLQWVGPNAAFDPSKVGADPEPYRLAWVVNARPSGSVAEYVRLITLYVDAADGSIIGGDVVE